MEEKNNSNIINKIILKGAREHNLKNINLEIQKNQLVVFTGVSGSGKSSLVFDTIYAEGQRRFVESLSSYARQFLERMNKPDLDFIYGISPAVAIEQKPAQEIQDQQLELQQKFMIICVCFLHVSELHIVLNVEIL